MKADMNQASDLEVLSIEEFDKQYGLSGRGKTSEFDIPMFYDAVELAKKNPNMFVKYYSFTSKDYKQVKRKGQACAQFATKYFKDNKMTTYVATTRKIGYGVEVFIINEQPTEVS